MAVRLLSAALVRKARITLSADDDDVTDHGAHARAICVMGACVGMYSVSVVTMFFVLRPPPPRSPLVLKLPATC